MTTLKIVREYGQKDIVKFRFRYAKITPEQKIEIEHDLKELTIKSKLSKDTNLYVMLFDLEMSVDPQRICDLNNKLALDQSNFGVYVSLTTQYDHSALSFPDYILHFIDIVGGQIELSLIMLPGNE